MRCGRTTSLDFCNSLACSRFGSRRGTTRRRRARYFHCGPAGRAWTAPLQGRRLPIGSSSGPRDQPVAPDRGIPPLFNVIVDASNNFFEISCAAHVASFSRRSVRSVVGSATAEKLAALRIAVAAFPCVIDVTCRIGPLPPRRPASPFPSSLALFVVAGCAAHAEKVRLG